MELQFSVENVTFGYSGRPDCLERISFEVRQGERIALLGANGSGKSTLLHLLDGLYFPRSGTITSLGHVLTEEGLEKPPFGPRFRREVGFLFQNSDAQLFCSTVEEELAFGPLQLRLPPGEILRRVTDTLELLEIAHLRDRAPQTLSGGEQKRVALASLLVTGPSILLLDEPTAGLDPRSRFRLVDLLTDLHEAGFTLITATHDLSVVPALADRALVISEDHRLVADGTESAVLNDADLLISANLIHPRDRMGDRDRRSG